MVVFSACRTVIELQLFVGLGEEEECRKKEIGQMSSFPTTFIYLFLVNLRITYQSNYPTSTSIVLLLPSSKTRRRGFCSPPTWRWYRTTTSATIRIGVDEITQVLHNKVLLAATLSAAVGQLSKPLTSAFNGDGFDLKAAIRSGGMPSTHSASVVAAATSLGLERGFADSIFGMSVVFASIVMYDAQGVRREVGLHSKAFNSLIKTQYLHQEKKPDSSIGSSVNSTPLSLSEKNTSDLNESSKLEAVTSTNLMVNGEEEKEGEMELVGNFKNIRRLNEYVGHTELQVLVGATLGLVVSLAVEALL